MKYKINIPEDVLFIIKKIEDIGHSAWIVGGAIRNQIINQAHNENYKINDYDIATDCPYESLKYIFKDFLPKEIGKNFGVLQVEINNISYEIAKFRIEDNYLQRRPQAVSFTDSILNDLKRRDFTCNAIAYNPTIDTIFDPLGGIYDIENNRISFIGDYKERLEEDSLRWLRLFRFIAEYKFTFDTDIPINDIEMFNDSITKLPEERIFEEFNKIILTDLSKNNILGIMANKNLLYKIFPELLCLKNYDQNNKNHIYTLDIHTFKTVEGTAPILEIRLAALFHDIGKPYCKSTDTNGISHYYNHNSISSNMCSQIMRRCKYSNEQIKLVSKLVYHHMKVISNIKITGIKNIIKDIGIENMENLVNLFYADAMACNPNIEFKNILNFEENLKKIKEEKQPIYISDLKITGNDLLNLNIKEGKEIGNILFILMQKVLENPDLNTKDKLLEIVYKLINKEIPQLIIMSAIPRSGKAQPLYSKIYTPNGFKTFRDIQEGDEILNEIGGISKVIQIHPISKEEVFEILFSDGSIVRCSKNHIWNIHKDTFKDKNKFINMTTEDIINTRIKNMRCTGNYSYYYKIPIIKNPIFFKEQSTVINPYLLGLILGDGSICNGTVQITNSEEDIVDKIKSIIKNNTDNIYIRQYGIQNYFSKINIKQNEFILELKKLNLFGLKSCDKFIPDIYLYNSYEKRLELIRGLIDTDGSLLAGRIYYSSTSLKLINNLKFLIESIGGTAIISSYIDKRNKNYCYGLSIQYDNENNDKIFSSKKHLSRYIPRQSSVFRKIVDIKYIGIEDCRCITTSNETGLYITDNCIITHNSTFANDFVEKNKSYFILSENKLRTNLLGNKGDMSNEKLIWQIHNAMFTELVLQRKNIIIDNTNISIKARKSFIEIAKKYNYSITGIHIDTRREICLQRAEESNFPKDVIENMFKRFEALSYSEGFDKIEIIKGK